MAKVILDMDPGIDDALAIMLAVNSPELEVLGITTVSGNVHVDKSSVNALRVLEVLGRRDIPVFRGAAEPLVKSLVTAEWVHGEDGLGDAGIPMASRKPVDGAVKFLIETLSSERDVTLIATGPLTNIAHTLLIEPAIAKHLKQLILMGGAYGLTPYGYGNETPVSEFNIYVDPEAAKIVFQSGLNPLCIGLDVTTNPAATLSKKDVEKMASSSSETARTAAKIVWRFAERFGFVQLHDPMAVAASINPSLFKTNPYHVYVVCDGELTRGQTIVERRFWIKREPNAEVCEHVDGPRFLAMFQERLR
ncbi:MAG: nucleoside hydrolase [Candidatus Caldarchaeum sp.]